MSTSVFYRALGIHGYKHQSIREGCIRSLVVMLRG